MLAKQLQGAAKSAVPQYIEDVFSTYLYTGTGSSQTITNNIDTTTYGGLVWIKGRSGATGHRLTDTARGTTKSLESNSTAAEATESTGLTAFGTTGFTIGADADYNTNTATYASWTFRKQAKFFDVVTWSGNSTAGRTIPHNLGSVPGCIIVKCTSNITDWAVYHRSLSSAANALQLNTTGAQITATTYWNSTAPTSSVFTVGADNDVNATGRTYVAYLFAHDAGGFGAAGTDNVISCGSYTGDGAATKNITINYEPQWVLVKNASAATNWLVIDQMRGMPAGTDNSALLNPNLSNAESSNNRVNTLSATGFLVQGAAAETNASGNTYIYIAIRRGPMKTPTSGTSVFTPTKVSGSSLNKTYSVGFPADLFIGKDTLSDAYQSWVWQTRLTKDAAMSSDSTSAESIGAWGNDGVKWDRQNSIYIESTGYLDNSPILYTFRRAPGFFDVVCYTGTGTSTAFNHNLTVVPEMIITKIRNSGVPNWGVWHNALSPSSAMLFLNTTGTQGNGYVNTVTSTTFSFATANGVVNSSGNTYIAYLFATVAGVSKVGSYQGNGTSKTIDCGFTAGARFVMIKRTDSTGDWYVWDTARGIVSGNDPRISMNSTAAEVTTDDTVDPDNSGFIVNQVAATNVNVNNATYIFLAIA